MPQRSPHRPVFDPRIRRGTVTTGSAVGTRRTNVNASTVTLLVSIPTPTVTASSPALAVVGSVTDVLLDRVTFIIYGGDGHCYLTSNPNDRLISVNVTTPASPTVAGSRTSSNSLDQANGLAKSGNYVYVACGLDTLVSSNDVSTPSSITFGDTVVDTTNLPNLWGIDVEGSYAFTCAQQPSANDRLTSIDISDPLNLTVADSVQDALFNIPLLVVADGDYAYVLSDTISDTLTVVDISDPTNMSIVAQLTDTTLGGSEGQMIKDGDVLYVTRGGLTTIDVSTPASPAILDQYTAGSFGSNGVTKIGDIVFTCRFTNNSVSALDASDPSNLSLLDTLTDNTNLSGVQQLANDGTYIFASVFTGDRLTVLEYA